MGVPGDEVLLSVPLDGWLWAGWLAEQLAAAGFAVRRERWEPSAPPHDQLRRWAATSCPTVVIATDAVVASDVGGPASALPPEVLAALRARLIVAVVDEAGPGDALGDLGTTVRLVDFDAADAALDAVLGALGEGGPAKRASTTAGAHPFPPSLPPVWNVPHPKNLHWVRRPSFEKFLEEGFADRRPDAPTIVALVGPSGLGKTHLAIEFAHRHVRDFDVVWWMQGNDDEALRGAFAALSGALRLPTQDNPEQAAVVNAVKSWLEDADHDRWLLVFDGCEAVDQVERLGLLPHGGAGHIIVTALARGPAGAPGQGSHPHVHEAHLVLERAIAPFSRGQAREFIAARLPDQGDDGDTHLATDLKHSPLALDLATAYALQAELSASACFDRYRARSRELRSGLDGRPTDGDDPRTAPLSVIMSLAIEDLAQRHPAAAHLFELLAFLGPVDIPVELFDVDLEQVDRSLGDLFAGPGAFTEAIESLQRYHLVRGTVEGFAVHRLLQRAQRRLLPLDLRRARAGTALRLALAAFPVSPGDDATWRTCERLLPHMATISRHAARLGVGLLDTAELLSRTAAYLRTRARYVEAHEQLKTAVALAEKAAGGEHHVEVARLRLALGAVFRDLGELSRARSECERAVTILTRSPGATDEHHAAAIGELGTVLRHQAALPEARAHHERALALQIEASGLRHPAIARRLADLGRTLRALGMVCEAERCFEGAFDVAEEVLESEADVARCQLHLAGSRRDRGRLEEAEDLVRAALATIERTHADKNPDVAHALVALAAILRERGDLREARECQERALRIREAIFGHRHYEVARAAHNLGWLLWELGRPSEAREQHIRALTILRSTYGERHPEVAGALTGIALAEQDSHESKRRAARQQLTDALDIYVDVYGRAHPSVAEAHDKLGYVLRLLGKTDESKDHHARAIAIFEACLGSSAHQLAIPLTNLGLALADAQVEAGRRAGTGLRSTYPELLLGARRCHERALALLDGGGGVRERVRAIVQRNLAECLLLLAAVPLRKPGRAKEDLARLALEAARGAHAGFLRVHGPDHPDCELANQVLERASEPVVADLRDGQPRTAQDRHRDLPRSPGTRQRRHAPRPDLRPAAGAGRQDSPLPVFVSYARKDLQLYQEFRAHLSGLERSGLVTVWSDRKIAPGEQFDPAITRRLESSSIFVALISRHFVASTYCWDVEVKTALEREGAGSLVIIPVVVADTSWEVTPLGRLNGLPEDDEGRVRAVKRWRDRDMAWTRVCAGVQRAALRLGERHLELAPPG